MKALMIIITVISYHQKDLQLDSRIVDYDSCVQYKAVSKEDYNKNVECVPLMEFDIGTSQRASYQWHQWGEGKEGRQKEFHLGNEMMAID